MSDSIFPPGWCYAVGQQVSAPPDYGPPRVEDVEAVMGRIDPKENIQVGMKFEAIDPMQPANIAAATVEKVLNYGYFLCSIDGAELDPSIDASDGWYCFHITSQDIFPCGFCEANRLTLAPPPGWKLEDFTWKKYFEVHKDAKKLNIIRVVSLGNF